jgi:hypothetical protein
MTGKHPKFEKGESTYTDLDVNPGIGSSKGAYSTGEDPRNVEADNTIEGDVENDTTPQGGVDPNQMGRTNK